MKNQRTKSRPYGTTPSFTAVPRQQAVSPKDGRKQIEGRKRRKSTFSLQAGTKPAAGPIITATAPGFASNTTQGTMSIEEMARALKNDVDLIFEFVANQIEFLPTYGSRKGALGTLIDGFGNAFDQSDLMVALLTEAGYTAGYVFGDLDLSESEAAAWLGTDPSNIWAASNLLSDGGIPNEVVWTGTEYRLELTHCWVKCTIDSTDYVFDPAMKAYDIITGIDLETATGFDVDDYMDDATDGATVASDYVQDMNRTNIRSNLDTMTSNLVDYINTNVPGASLDEVLGGRKIVPQTSQVRQTSLSYEKSGQTLTDWSSIPTAYKATLSVEYDGIDETFYSADIHGKRLSLFFNGSHEAELRLDGLLVATSNAQTPGSWNSVLLTIEHPYPTTFADDSVWHRIWADKPYIIAQAWGNCNRGMLDLHNRKLQEAKFNGGSSGSEEVLGEWLELEWHTWNSQKSFAADIANRLSNCTTVLHHQGGIVGYFDAILGDLGCILWASSALDNDWDRVSYNDDTLALHGVAFEAAAIQQTDSRMDGVSATPLIDIANTAGLKIYDGKSSNWTSGVKPNLTNYDSGDLTDIENWFINWGWRVAIPEDGELASEDWEGYAYFAISPWQGAYGIIGGGLKGKTGNKNRPTPDEKRKPEFIPAIRRVESADPVDLRNGDFRYTATDLAVGSAAYPYGLSFRRNFSSGGRYSDGPLGVGWSHSYNLSVAEDSDGLRGLGWDSPIAGAAGIVEMFVCVELYKDLSKPFDRYITAILGNQWLVDNVTNNIVTVNFMDGNQFFVKLPDGSYVAPTQTASSLVKNMDDSFTYTTPQQVVYNYNTDGTIDEIVYPFGMTISFTYTSGLLTSVSNGLGRELTFTYTSGRITSVEDDASRSISYDYDGDGNLVEFTNADGKTTTFAYDDPGLLTEVYLPEDNVNPVVQNIYDTLGRVKEQINGDGKHWYYYIAGHRAEEVNPNAKKSTLYFDRFGRVVRFINALGHELTREYDGRTRLVKVIQPEGNSTEYGYDLNGNVLTETHKAKSGSGLSDIVSSYSYDSTWNKVATATNPLGEVTIQSVISNCV